MLRIIAIDLEPQHNLEKFHYPALGKDIFVDWNQKIIIKSGLAKGTRYKIFSLHDNKYIFYTWATRKEIKDWTSNA